MIHRVAHVVLRRPEGIDLKYLLRTQHNNLFVQMLAIFSKPVSTEDLIQNGI